MPTEADFKAAATSCRESLTTLTQLRRSFLAVEEFTGLEGTGTVLDKVVKGVRACTENVKAMNTDFEATADTLDTRAKEAAAYTVLVKEWRRKHQTWVNDDAAHRESRMGPSPTDSPGMEPMQPPKVPEYVDESHPGSL